MREKRYMISDASKMIDVEPHGLRYWEQELGIEIPRNELGHRFYTMEHIELLKSAKALKEKGFQLKAIKLLLPDIKKVEALETERLYDLRDKLEIAMGLVGIEARDKDMDEVAISVENMEKLKGEGVMGDTSTCHIIEAEKLGQEDKVERRKEDSRNENKSFNLIEETSACVDVKEDKLGQFRSIMRNIMLGAMDDNNEHLSSKISNMVTDSVVKELDYRLRVREEREEERFKQLDRTIREYQLLRQQTAASKEMSGQKRKESKFFKKNNKVRI